MTSLSPEQLQQIADARLRMKKIRRAISVATFDAWTVAIFAGGTLLVLLLSFSIVGLMMGVGMAAVACIEFRAIGRLRRLDPTAARSLGWNQVFFAALLFSYACYGLYTTFMRTSEYAEIIGSYPELGSTLGSMDQLTKILGAAVYGALAVVAITVQGSTALFHFTREKYVRDYVTNTPAWIIQMQQAGAQF